MVLSNFEELPRNSAQMLKKGCVSNTFKREKIWEDCFSETFFFQKRMYILNKVEKKAKNTLLVSK